MAAGMLSPEERIELEAMWREAFDRGRDLKFADVPVELRRRWERERRRRKAEPPAAMAATGSEDRSA